MAEIIYDERIEEGFLSLGGGVFELTGAAELKFAFSTATRRDGSPIQSGDEATVAFLNKSGQSIVCKGVYTAGSPALLTINAAEIYKSSEPGGGAPDFGATTGTVFHAWAAKDVLKRNLAGDLEDPDVLRRVTAPSDLDAFALETGTVNGEGAMAQGGVDVDDMLGGLFGADTGFAGPSNDKESFASATAGVFIRRRTIKTAFTFDPVTIIDGAFLSMINANDPTLVYELHYVSDDGAHQGFALISGDAADPEVDVVFERGLVIFDQSGASVGVRNNSGGPVNIANTPSIKSAH